MGRKKHNIAKRTNKMLVGLQLRWIDTNPLADTHIVDVAISHKNPMLRPHATRMYNQQRGYITTVARCWWRITLVSVFRYPNGIDQREESEITAHCAATELNDAAIAEIEDHMAEIEDHIPKGAHYLHTEFTVECVSTSPHYEAATA